MHALVSAVLLGMAGLDTLDSDSEPEPPHRQLGEVEQSIGRGEGHAVIGADGEWQASLLEEALEGCEGKVFAGRFERLAQEQIARGVIGNRKGIAVGFVAELKLALIIGAPQIVWRKPQRQWRSGSVTVFPAHALITLVQGRYGARRFRTPICCGRRWFS